MLLGVFYALAACALWGLVFVIPGILGAFTPFEIAFGRTAFFGVFCTGLLCFSKRHLMTQQLRPLWIQALKLALVANILHYIFLVLCTRYAHAAIATMLLAIAPVTIVLYGNLRTKSVPIIQLLPFCTLILMGVLFLTIPPILQLKELSSTFLIGFVFGILALATWTWYIVVNAITLQGIPTLNPSDWVTVIGAATLMLTIGTAPVYFFINPIQKGLGHYLPLLAGSAVLGLGSSWLANYFWNQATMRLSLTITGSLSVFETLFGLFYLHLLNNWSPNGVELTGILFILTGSFATLRFFQHFSIEKNA